MALTEEQKKNAYAYINEYKKNTYDRISVLAYKGFKEVLKEEAEKRGMSMSEFMVYCVETEIKRSKEK